HSCTAHLFSAISRPPHRSTLFPYTTLFRSTPRLNIAPAFPASAAFVYQLRAPTTSGGSDSFSNTPRLNIASAFPASAALSHQLRSEEHTSELQSQSNLVCRLLLEKKNQTRA